ncbi:MAG: secreted PhoX family phosphatase [Limimaricola cinnabarinus]|uniref:Putative phosphatase n=1 Tax=Limimaricola cinnabarinus LL-001 TaxID=1337093 RepID=U2YQ88_9RHOB|nr:PhoX family phosphatase [Limimaricola cinnabarinus]GAD57586.1 putative phosphatase [Limimaricola cinnabarinus LL-001]
MKFTIFDPLNRSQRFDAADDDGVNSSKAPTIGDVIAARMGRRDLMKGALGFTAIAATVSPMALAASRAYAQTEGSSFDFTEIEAGVSEDMVVAEGYDAEVLIRWGDPVLPGAPEFDVDNQTAEAQNQQFGYNSDFIGTVPHPEAPDDPDRLLLVNHHEYTNEELMFPGLGIQDDAEFAKMTQELVDIEKAAHGGSVIEIRRGEDGKWSVVRESTYNRRITAETPMKISGPAAGHARMQTNADPSGTEARGTFNNCAGGITPWGTWLMAEENFNGYFWSDQQEPPATETSDDPATILNARYGVPGKWYAWGKFDDRFNIDKEPNEPNRHGWIVEVNPADPNSTPVKRTALGRVKHEGAMPAVNGDGRVALFMGDDERFDYVYRFVTEAAYDEANPDPDILDRGTLSVARFDEDGSVTWLPLIHGEGPLTAENGFADQGDVLVQTRRAADFLEATPMDRPEDVEPNEQTGRIYVMLTNNTRRKPGDENAANPRAENAFGHIIEITAPEGDFAADTMSWEILVKCGDPSVEAVGATFSPATSENGWFGMPDNCAIDAAGRLWISTDGNSAEDTGRADGLWAMETDGEMRGTSKHFFRVPVGAEMCGPWFVNDDQTLFLAVQHPGDGSTFEDPSTRWPDFADGMPPRPAVVVIQKQGGGRIG